MGCGVASSGLRLGSLVILGLRGGVVVCVWVSLSVGITGSRPNTAVGLVLVVVTVIVVVVVCESLGVSITGLLPKKAAGLGLTVCVCGAVVGVVGVVEGVVSVVWDGVVCRGGGSLVRIL